jgi:hypothetical protein
MHSLIYAELGHTVADERATRPMARAVRPQRPKRPPNPPIRARAAYATGRLARRLDREMARRAVV